MRSDGNLVDPSTIELNVSNAESKAYLWNKADGFFGAMSGQVAAAATQGLGHSCVADFPDRPFLRWTFAYEDGTPSLPRDNQATYIEACEKLFKFFLDFKLAATQYAEDMEKRSFESIRPTIIDILAFEGKKEERSDQWREAASNGNLLFTGDIPDYCDAINAEIGDAANKTVDEVINSNAWRFTRSIEIVRSILMNEIIPTHGLIG